MMIKDAFKNGNAFIAFVTCGDPDLDTTAKLLVEMANNGVDLIELGIPFSDPTAEGPVIQDANLRALTNGVTTDKIFDMVDSIKDKMNIPMVFMTYANVVFSYGTNRFLARAKEVGMSGIILPDIPFEEKHEFSDVCDEYGLEFVSLIAPTSDNRIQMIAKDAKGFVYCVSSMGVTGTRSTITTDVGAMVNSVRTVTDIPVAIGFGISNPEQASAMAKHADGIIIGSAIIKIIEKYGKNAVEPVCKFVRDIKSAINT